MVTKVAHMAVRKLNTLSSAMEITKFPNSPIIKGVGDKLVLVIGDGDTEYMLGHISFGDTVNPQIVYQEQFFESYGYTINDLYNNISSVEDFNAEVNIVQSLKRKTVLVGDNKFIGEDLHDGDVGSDNIGFVREGFFVQSERNTPGSPNAPVAPFYNDEVDYVSLSGGNKIYDSSSGSLQEANAIRINIGVGDTDIHSWGQWTEETLSVETPIERSARSMSVLTYASGSRSGSAFPQAGTYHIYNFVDDSSFFMGNGIVEIEKANDDNTEFAKTIWDADGVIVEVDTGGIVTLKVGTTTLIVNDGTVNITGDMTFTGDLRVTGKLTVDTEVDLLGFVKVNTSGKLITTGGNDLA